MTAPRPPDRAEGAGGAPVDPPPADVFRAVATVSDRPRSWPILLVVVALAITIVKPWGWGQPPASAATRGTSRASPAEVSPSRPSPARTSLATTPPFGADPAVAVFCLDPTVWQIATSERWRSKKDGAWRDQTVRVWRATEPLPEASGPDDPRIPVTPVLAEGVTALGWCVPVVGEERPAGVATVAMWRVTPAGPIPTSLDRVRPADGPSAFGSMYGPPDTRPGRAGGPLSWPSGRFVFRYRLGAGHDRWFAVDVEIRASDAGPSS